MAPPVRHDGAMDLSPYVDKLRRELMVAAEAGGEDARALAERLVAPLESAVRLTLLDALSTAADEITRDLAPRSVEVRLRGLDPSFVVTPPSGLVEGMASQGKGSPSPNQDEGATARINFRPPEHLKTRIEEAAGRDGLSVNAWLVAAVTATLNHEGSLVSRSGQYYSGWVR
jgi:hypothetical protein